ncbi:hypothetical protein SAEN111111_06955 [Saccharibacillus endophyticus]
MMDVRNIFSSKPLLWPKMMASRNILRKVLQLLAALRIRSPRI